MKPLFLLFFVVACAAMLEWGQPGPADPAIPDVIEAKDETIRLLEGHNEQLRRELLFIRIEQCESSFNHAAVSPSGKSKGRYQFKKATFEWMKQRSGMDYLEYTESADQELMARFMLGNGLQEHFECYDIVITKWPELTLETSE
jgi:hypothetical protein